MSRAGPRLEELARHRQRRLDDHQRPRGHLDPHAHARGTTASSRPSSSYEWDARRRARPARSSGSRRTRRPRTTVADAHDPTKTHPPVMLTTDLALRMDPAYEQISRRFLENPRRVRGRVRPRLVQADPPRHGPEVAATSAPRSRPRTSSGRTRSRPSTTRSSAPTTSPRSRPRSLASGLSVSQLVSTAWASASTFRGTDKRGGANGARIRLAPQNGWDVNDPAELAAVLRTLEGVQAEFNAAHVGGAQISLADLIVLGGRRRRREGGQGRRRRRRRAVHAGPHRRLAGADRRRLLRRARADRRRLPQLRRQGHAARRSSSSSRRRGCSRSPRPR